MAYTVEWEHQTIAAASGDYDIVEARPATAGQQLTLLGFEFDPTTVIQEADEEQWRWRIITMVGGTFTTGTGGATPTPAPLDLTPATPLASGFAADTMNTAVATTTGTTRNHYSGAFNARVGTGPIWFPEQARIVVPGQSNVAILIRLTAAITSDESCSGWACFVEGPR